MTILRTASLVCTICCTTFAVAADTSKTIIPDNVVSCQSPSCTSETLHGQNYKVLSTSQFTVMVSLSDDGEYTRADVSIANNTGLPLSVTPDDFRVEVLSPKPKVLLYIAPADRKLIPPPPTPQTAAAPATLQTPAPVVVKAPPVTPQEAAEIAAAQADLKATSLAPNQVLQGRVYFEQDKRAPHDKKAHLAKVVFPLAGEVFEFPYVIKP